MTALSFRFKNAVTVAIALCGQPFPKVPTFYFLLWSVLLAELDTLCDEGDFIYVKMS